MNHQQDNWEWAQHDVHDTLSCKMTDSEQTALIKAWKQSGSFEDTIKEITSKENCHE